MFRQISAVRHGGRERALLGTNSMKMQLLCYELVVVIAAVIVYIITVTPQFAFILCYYQSISVRAVNGRNTQRLAAARRQQQSPRQYGWQYCQLLLCLRNVNGNNA